MASLLEGKKKIHFIGIGGAGMSGLAKLLLQLGYEVSGSDIVKSSVTEKLLTCGAKVFYSHSAELVRGVDLVVYSSAIPEDNPERKAAELLNIPILHRSQLLTQILKLKGKKLIAVSGTNGKTTVSSMIFSVLNAVSLNPTAIIGGKVVELNDSAVLGNGEYFVAEADESDKSFLNLFPYIAVITNIDYDHLDNYCGSFANIAEAFYKFAQLIPSDGCVIFNADCPVSSKLFTSFEKPKLNFGIENSQAVFSASILSSEKNHLKDGTFCYRNEFCLYYKGKTLGKVALKLPGKHNVANALATFATCFALGLSFHQIKSALENFQGVERRFQIIGQVNGITIIDDYAHNPTKVCATVTAAKSVKESLVGKEGRIIVIFQPHRYTRTFYLAKSFRGSFKDADEVIITEIYPAGEKPIEGVSAESIVREVKEYGSPSSVSYIPCKNEINEYLSTHLKKGDLVLFLGAGDIWKLSRELFSMLKNQK